MDCETGIRKHKLGAILFVFLAFAAFTIWAPEAGAYSDFGGTGQNCKLCHTTFSGGTSNAAHQAHAAVVGGTCNTCHGGFPPSLNNCTQCHLAQGLRQHHRTAIPVAHTCASNCHTSPENGGTENTVPPGYAGTGLDPCDGSEERFASFTRSLDNDGDGLTDSADPDCQAVVNTPPVANPDSYNTPANTALNVGAPGVLGNDTDADGDPITAVKVANPAHGTVTLNANGSFTYTPAAGYSGPDSFTYKANDGTADGNTATVSITVTAAAGALSVSPADGLSSSGAPGGPFSPSSRQYTLTNTGGTSINWTASKTQTWVTLSPVGGTLAVGANDNVTVSINSGANTLVAGNYSDNVTFTNTTNGTGDTIRTVSLTVTTAPDTAPPIVSPPTSPDNNAVNVAVDTNVTATFNEPIASASVNATSFILSDGVDNVVGTFSVNGAVVTFDPSAALSDNTTYTATLTTGITDLAGNHLAGNYTWSFTTGTAGTPPPIVFGGGGGGGCAIAGSKGGIKEVVGAFGFLILTALGIAIRERVKRKEK